MHGQARGRSIMVNTKGSVYLGESPAPHPAASFAAFELLFREFAQIPAPVTSRQAAPRTCRPRRGGSSRWDSQAASGTWC